MRRVTGVEGLMMSLVTECEHSFFDIKQKLCFV